MCNRSAPPGVVRLGWAFGFTSSRARCPSGRASSGRRQGVASAAMQGPRLSTWRLIRFRRVSITIPTTIGTKANGARCLWHAGPRRQLMLPRLCTCMPSPICGRRANQLHVAVFPLFLVRSELFYYKLWHTRHRRVLPQPCAHGCFEFPGFLRVKPVLGPGDLGELGVGEKTFDFRAVFAFHIVRGSAGEKQSRPFIVA